MKMKWKVIMRVIVKSYNESDNESDSNGENDSNGNNGNN